MNLKILLILFIDQMILILGFKLQNHLSKREIKSLFDRDHNQIQDVKYEVVSIEGVKNLKRNKRSIYDSLINLKAFDKTYSLYLEETKHVLIGERTPIFTAKLKGSKIVYIPSNFAKVEGIKYYQNNFDKSALTVFTDHNGTQHINGQIGDDFIIRSIPAETKKRLDSLITDNHHVVIEKDKSAASLLNWAKNGISSNAKEKSQSRGNNRLKRKIFNNNIVDTVYPEVLVVVDYEIYETYNKNLRDIVLYTAAFWNGVDLRYREFDDPKVRLNIYGIVINTVKEVQPYFQPSILDESDDMSENMKKFAQKIGDHFCDTKEQTSNILGPKTQNCYGDIIFHVTPKYLFINDTKLIDGVALEEGVCEASSSSMAVTDLGGFSGIITAAHELGHIFGSPHDGDVFSKFPDDYCPETDGYIMSYTQGTKNRFYWSQCSKKHIQSFLKSKYAFCLRNEPKVGVPQLKKLPGKFLTRDQQCDKIYPGSVGIDQDCIKLTCGYWKNNQIEDEMSFGEPPAEGTSCGDKQMCLNERCVEDPALSIKNKLNPNNLFNLNTILAH